MAELKPALQIPDTVETRLWRTLGVGDDTIRKWIERRGAVKEDLARREAGGEFLFGRNTHEPEPLQPKKGQEEPGLVEKIIAAIDPTVMAVGGFAGVSPLTGKLVEREQPSPGGRTRPEAKTPTARLAEIRRAPGGMKASEAAPLPERAPYEGPKAKSIDALEAYKKVIEAGDKALEDKDIESLRSLVGLESILKSTINRESAASESRRLDRTDRKTLSDKELAFYLSPGFAEGQEPEPKTKPMSREDRRDYGEEAQLRKAHRPGPKPISEPPAPERALRSRLPSVLENIQGPVSSQIRLDPEEGTGLIDSLLSKRPGKLNTDLSWASPDEKSSIERWASDAEELFGPMLGTKNVKERAIDYINSLPKGERPVPGEFTPAAERPAREEPVSSHRPSFGFKITPEDVVGPNPSYRKRMPGEAPLLSHERGTATGRYEGWSDRSAQERFSDWMKNLKAMPALGVRRNVFDPKNPTDFEITLKDGRKLTFTLADLGKWRKELK